MGMSLAAQGAYIRLLCHAWRQVPPCTLPMDYHLIRMLCGASGDEWEMIENEIMEPWHEDNGRWRQKRLTQVWAETREAAKVRSSAGKKAAAARWENARGAIKKSDLDANALRSHCERNAGAHAIDAKRSEVKRSEVKRISPPKSPSRGTVGRWDSVLDLFPESHRTSQMRDAWESWMEHRRARAKLTQAAAEGQAKKLGKVSHAEAIEILEHSTASGYVGLFAPTKVASGLSPVQPTTRITGRRIGGRENPVRFTSESPHENGKPRKEDSASGPQDPGTLPLRD